MSLSEVLEEELVIGERKTRGGSRGFDLRHEHVFEREVNAQKSQTPPVAMARV